MPLNDGNESGSLGPLSRRGLLSATAGTVIAGVAGPVMAKAAKHRRGPLGVEGAATGMELLGEIHQEGQVLTACGYFTRIAGLDTEQLYFPGLPRGEGSARFTFFGTATVTSLNTRDTVFVASASGQLAFHLLDSPGATFDIPASFAYGKPVATDDAEWENVLNVTAPNIAVTQIFGDLQRTSASPFMLDGVHYQLGTMGLRSRLVAPGKGTRLDLTPRAVLVVAGNISNPQ